ncbi:protein FAM186A isoform X1 [Mauremys reevesii]|uniref:protein FAM186A isoform X1 n=2 Tax=Mauremys reevesii TaxID=260615 RepID=UPI00193FBF85|nr:protein FAM186A isoform X1 [Mauremys reevesii]
MVVQESSSSSSSGSSYKSETNSEPEPEAAASKLELIISPLTEIPPSVKNILEKIDAAQLDRARKEVFKQLFVILDNVNRVCDRFKGDERMDPEIEEQFFLSGTWAERKRRALLLDKVVILLKASTAQGKDLKFVLESLKEWGEMLSEGKEQVGDTPTVQWVSDMETKLLTSLDYTEGCIMQLINLCTPLVEHRRKKRGKSIVPKTGMWRAWREKVAQKPQEGQPLSPEQMLEDESVTFSRTSELLTMLQEFVGSTLFNKAEVVVVKYIVTMVANLNKAFTLLTKQSRGLQAKYDTLVSQESRKQEVQCVNLQKEVQVLNEKKASLEARVQSIEHKYKMLFIENEAIQKELHKVKEKAAVKIEPSLRDMKSGARASYEGKSQEDDKHVSREKVANLSVEKLSWKSQADLAKSPSGKRESKVPDKKQLQRPLVEKTEDTSDKQDAKLLDKKPALKASIERGEGTSDKQDTKLLDKKPAPKASIERGEDTSDKWDTKLLDKKPAPKASIERGEGTNDKQKAPVERTQDTVVKWDAVIPVEKQEETSGDLAGRRHEQPLDNEQTEAADKWDVNLLGGTQEVVEDVTGEWHEILPDEHELKADSEEEIERLPSPTELPYQGVCRKGKQRRKKESLYTEETHTIMPQSPISRSMLDSSTALYGFNSAILGYLEQKMEKLWKCPSPGKRQAERMLPKDPEAQRLYMALERKLEECFSKMKIRYSSSLEEQKLPRSLELTEEHDEEAKPPLEVLPGIVIPGKEVPGSSIQLSDPDSPFLESKVPVISRWGLPAALLKEPNISAHFQFPKQWQQQWQQQQQEQWQEEEQEWFKKVQKQQQYQMQWQSPQPEEQLQQQLQGVKEKVEVEQLQQEEHQFEELQPQQEPLQEGQKEWQEEKHKQWKKQLEEQAEEQSLRQQQLEQQQRLYQQWQEEQQKKLEEQQRLWRQQEEEQEEVQRLWQQQQEERQRLWHQHEEEQQEEQLKLWQQEEQEHEQQARYWQQQVEEHEEQQHLWQQEQEEHDLHLRQWQQQEVKQQEQEKHWQQQVEEHEKQRQLWQQEQEEHDLRLRQWQQQEVKQQEQERLWQQQWQEQLQQLHEQQELLQKQIQQEQYLIPRPKPVPRSREPGTLEHLTKQIPLRPRREIAKEEVLLYEYFKPSTQQMVPTQSKVSLHSQAQSTEETSWLPTLAQKTKGKSLVPSGMSEKRYWVDVEAQRENLMLLGQATQKCRLPPHLHMQAKEVITETLHTDVERLALLFHKYISFCHLQHVRQTLMSRLEAARAVNDGAEVRNLYTYVERVDAYRKKVLQCWVAKQKTAEQARRHCLGKMISLFAQLRLSTELHLNSPSPLMIKAVDEMKEFPSSAHARSKSPGYPSPLACVKKVRDFMHPAGVSEQVCDQIESVWRTDVISHSFPIVPKPPVSLLWSQAGFPDIPRFLELDVSSLRSKPLKSLQTRVQNLPRWKTYGHK